MWINNNLVQDAVYRRLTGQSKHWLNWVFEDYIQGVKGKMLSIGSETALHELAIASIAPGLEIVAVESDPGLADIGRANAEAAGANIVVKTSSIDAFLSSNEEKFDFILSVNALDRASDVQSVCKGLANALTPEGIFCLTEYVGPAHLELSQRQEEAVDQFLSALDPDWKTWPNATFKMSDLIESTKQSGRRKDPNGVMIALERNFDFLLRRYGGGGLLEPMFASLNEDRLNNGSPESCNIARLLIAAEDQLINAGIVPNHVFLGICRSKAS
jgi:SAM-dependent methyltransferase